MLLHLRNSDIVARAKQLYGDTGHHRIKTWLNFIDDSTNKSEWQKIHLVNDFFNKRRLFNRAFVNTTFIIYEV